MNEKGTTHSEKISIAKGLLESLNIEVGLEPLEQLTNLFLDNTYLEGSRELLAKMQELDIWPDGIDAVNDCYLDKQTQSEVLGLFYLFVRKNAHITQESAQKALYKAVKVAYQLGYCDHEVDLAENYDFLNLIATALKAEEDSTGGTCTVQTYKSSITGIKERRARDHARYLLEKLSVPREKGEARTEFLIAELDKRGNMIKEKWEGILLKIYVPTKYAEILSYLANLEDQRLYNIFTFLSVSKFAKYTGIMKFASSFSNNKRVVSSYEAIFQTILEYAMTTIYYTGVYNILGKYSNQEIDKIMRDNLNSRKTFPISMYDEKIEREIEILKSKLQSVI